MPIHAVTLDATGTLLTPGEPVGVTYARVAAEHGLEISPARADMGFRAALAAAPPLAFPGSPAADVPMREQAWWTDVVQHALGVPPGAATACAAALFAYYATPAAWRVPADVLPAMDALTARGLRLAVVSNFDGRLGPLLAALGLTTDRMAVIVSSAVGAAKPDPAIFAAALATLAVAPDETLHIGDDPITDVLGARSAGLRAALLDRANRTSLDGVPVITTLDAVLDLLD